MILLTLENFELKFTGKVVPMRNIVHYELFQIKVKELEYLKLKASKLEYINKGKATTAFYIKLLIYKLLNLILLRK